MTEARALIANARAEAGRVAAAATADAEGSAKRREKMAIDRIAAAEKAAVDDVRLAAADMATVAARQVLSQGLSAEADAHLIDQAIVQLAGRTGRSTGGIEPESLRLAAFDAWTLSSGCEKRCRASCPTAGHHR